jgi:hypothetical protein
MLFIAVILQLFSGAIPGMQIFDPLIKTIEVYPARSISTGQIRSAAVPLGNQNLIVEFDDLRESTENYYATLIHCNRDWQQSGLRDLEFMSVYNEFNINDYAYSSNTHLPYVHYRFEIPPVKVPGNYVLLVYRDGDKSEKVFTRRIMVYGSMADAMPLIRPGQAALDRNLQQINFTVTYPELDVPDPMKDIRVVVRQNSRWDNALTELLPVRADNYRKQLEYVYFDKQSAFGGGNEFRFFDISSINFPGQNTGYLEKSSKPYHLFVAKDKPRGHEVYAQYRDMNGGFIIENRDAGSPETTGQYLYVHFLLDYTPADGESVWVGGNWSDWSSNDAYKMRQNGKLMEAVILLKQGFYNYRFTSIKNGKQTSVIEGDYAETENDYDILVYVRDIRLQADVLAGYSGFKFNPR